jgi:hypothetical protein
MPSAKTDSSPSRAHAAVSPAISKSSAADSAAGTPAAVRARLLAQFESGNTSALRRAMRAAHCDNLDVRAPTGLCDNPDNIATVPLADAATIVFAGDIVMFGGTAPRVQAADSDTVERLLSASDESHEAFCAKIGEVYSDEPCDVGTLDPFDLHNAIDRGTAFLQTNGWVTYSIGRPSGNHKRPFYFRETSDDTPGLCSMDDLAPIFLRAETGCDARRGRDVANIKVADMELRVSVASEAATEYAFHFSIPARVLAHTISSCIERLTVQ